MTEPYRTVYRAEQCSPLYAHTVQNSKIYGTVQFSTIQTSIPQYVTPYLLYTHDDCYSEIRKCCWCYPYISSAALATLRVELGGSVPAVVTQTDLQKFRIDF